MKNKRFFFVLTVLFTVNSVSLCQSSNYKWLSKNSWSVGFGGTYPKYVSTNVDVREESGYGGYASIQRNFSEHIGLRFEINFIYLDGLAGSPSQIVTNNLGVGNFGLLYYFVPCEPISPYLSLGLGFFYSTIDNSPIAKLNDSYVDYQLNLNFGAEWRLTENWKIKTEVGSHFPASTKFDGLFGTTGGGLLGGIYDTYMSFDLGFLYYFSYGEKSNLCDIYEGIGTQVDYNKIEEIVKKYTIKPVEVDYDRIESIVKRHKVPVIAEDNWVLVGVNFDFDKADIRPESIPILLNAVQILSANPDIKIEVQGYTDNLGSDSYNQRLSLKRAEAVKNYLAAKGINQNRITTASYGKSKPVADNNTAEGRALNRRIEFKILN
jgi:OOP family OmpA-OmpF porin